MDGNSLLHPPHEVRFGEYVADDVADAVEVTLAAARRRYAEALAIPPADRTFGNTVLGFTRAREDFDALEQRISHLAAVLPGWDEAAAMVGAAKAELDNEVGFSGPLYSLLRDLHDAPGRCDSLPANQHRLLRTLIDSYERNGVALPPQQQAELGAVRTRLGELQREFKANAVEAARHAGLLVADARGLAGMPETFVQRCAEAARERGEAGYWVAYSQPVYVEIMTSCSAAETRRRMYDVQITLAADANGAVAEETLLLRRRQAQLLGFATYADLVTGTQMAGSADAVATFLSDLAGQYRPLALAEHAALTEHARKFENDPHLQLTAADVDTGYLFYYDSQRFGEIAGVDSSTLREYLPLPRVVAATFEVMNSLYGVSFSRVDVPTWHPEVEAYEIRDEAGRHRATMYADWIARDDKGAGAWKGNLYVPPRGAADNGRPYVGYVLFNLAPAEPGQPVLCHPENAVNVLHEVGHIMHEVLSEVELPEQGPDHCHWDFVEAPSLIMENWFWQPEVISRITGHYATGEPLPPETLERLKAAASYRVGGFAIRQLYLALVDLELHRSYEGGDVHAFAREVKGRLLTAPVEPHDKFVGAFLHVMSEGYSATYYSYHWAMVLEAAMFELFTERGVLNRDLGRFYARTVLSRGNEAEPDELVRDFLGRPPTYDALLRRDGVI